MPRGDGTLRLVEAQAEGVLIRLLHRRGGGKGTVTDACLHAQGRIDAGESDEVDAVGGQLAREQILVAAKQNGAVLGVFSTDVGGLSKGDPQPLALSDRIVNDSTMTAKDPSISIHKIALGIAFFRVTHQKGGIVAVRNEADVLTVAPHGTLQTVLLGDLADLGLGQVAQRKKRLGKLLLREGPKHIGLILGAVTRHGKEHSAASVLRDTSVMSGGKVRALQPMGFVKQSAEFDASVAFDTRVGGRALLIAAHEIVHDRIPKVLLQVAHRERDPELLGGKTGVLDLTGHGGKLSVRKELTGREELHGDTVAVIPLRLEKQGSNAAVNTAAHGDENGSGHVGELLSFDFFKCY